MKPHDMPDVELRNEGAIMPGEPLNGWYSGEPLNYQLEVTESSLVTLEMRSADFDTFIEISGQGVAASDDDGAGGTDSRLQEPLLPGTYTVSARGFSATGSGLFELSLEMEPTDIPQICKRYPHFYALLNAFIAYGGKRVFIAVKLRKPARLKGSVDSVGCCRVQRCLLSIIGMERL